MVQLQYRLGKSSKWLNGVSMAVIEPLLERIDDWRYEIACNNSKAISEVHIRLVKNGSVVAQLETPQPADDLAHQHVIKEYRDFKISIVKRFATNNIFSKRDIKTFIAYAKKHHPAETHDVRIKQNTSLTGFYINCHTCDISLELW